MPKQIIISYEKYYAIIQCKGIKRSSSVGTFATQMQSERNSYTGSNKVRCELCHLNCGYVQVHLI